MNILVTAHKSDRIYYTKDGAIFSTDLDTHATQEIAKIPVQGEKRRCYRGKFGETMLVGVAGDPEENNSTYSAS